MPRHPSASELSKDVRAAGGEVIFDPMTHARFLPGTNKTGFYDAWDLWGPTGTCLDDTTAQVAHIERVFEHQSQIRAPHLAPTLQLQTPHSDNSSRALDMARVARGLDKGAWQSLVGTRAFWSSGPHLDAYVGTLSSLRAPVWMITVANEIVAGQVPDLTDTAAFAGLCRTVHSLSLRSRVILAFGDFAGLPAIAAGADTLGSGWDRGQRTFDPLSYRENSDDSPRRPASYVTHGELNAVLRRDTADAITRWDASQAERMRGGPMPPTDNVERMHHLQQLRRAVMDVAPTGATRQERIDALRHRYATAAKDFDALIPGLPRIVRESDKEAWVINPCKILETYATSEGF